MKKVLVVLAIILIVAFPIVAKSEIGVGLNLGTNSGITGTYDAGKWDIFGTLGFGVIGQSFSAEVGGEYNVYDFSIDKADFNVNAGGMVGVDAKTGLFNINVLGVGSLHYEFKEVPIDTFIRLGAGLGLDVSSATVAAKFAFSGAIGGVYKFSL